MVVFIKDKWVWMPNEKEAWLPVKLISKDSGTIFVEDYTGTEYKIKEDEPLTDVLPTSLKGIPDMIELEELSEGAILHTLRVRYAKNEIYTYISSILIAINPYYVIPGLYTQVNMSRYAAHRGKEPHPYKLADRAYNGLISDEKDQSMVISGESGSGKTETTKIIMRYLAYLSGAKSNIEKQILESNPVIEAFGNAKTVRNNNSSRFGKWIALHYNKKHKIMGSAVTSFLLEKSRVVGQAKGERNYHIFYQFACGLSANDRAKYNIAKPKDYAYLNGGVDLEIPGISDRKEFNQTLESLMCLAFTQNDVQDIFHTLSAILHVGNLEFKEHNDETSSITTKKALEWAAKMFDVEVSALEKALTTRDQSFPDKKEIITIPFNKEEALANRDSLSKHVYERMFQVLIQQINKLTHKKDKKIEGVIGILDIFGFEVFDVNRFEQLCVNYTNEKLQQVFNNHVFVLEQEEYKKEGIELMKMNYNDNQKTLNLIEKTPFGILPMLDEEVVLPRGSDANYLLRLHKKHQGNALYIKPRLNVPQFGIRHYAGIVTYNVGNFYEKNKNAIRDDLVKCLRGSGRKYFQELFPEEKKQQNAKAGRRMKKSTRQTLGGGFRKQLGGLMKELNGMAPHFIRCVKPNQLQKPKIYDSPLINLQLRNSGIQAVINIRKMGWPDRQTHKAFYARYKICVDQKKLVDSGDYVKLCKALIAQINLDKNDYRIGRTKVFMRHHTKKNLEKLRDSKIEQLIIQIQAGMKSYLLRKKFQCKKWLKRAEEILQKAIESKKLEKLRNAIASAKRVGYASPLLDKAMDLLEREVRRLLKESVASGSLDDVRKALAIAKDCGMQDDPAADDAREFLQLAGERARFAIELKEALEPTFRDEILIMNLIRAGKEIKMPENDPLFKEAIRWHQGIQEARRQLNRGVDQKDISILEEWVPKAHKMGMNPKDEAYKRANELYKFLSTSEESLSAAIKEGDLDVLIRVVADAKATGYRSKLVREAERILEKRLRQLLNEGIAQKSASKLDKGIRLAELADFSDKSLIAEAEETRLQVRKEKEVIDQLVEALRVKDEDGVNKALDKVDEYNIAENDEIKEAREWKRALLTCRQQLKLAVLNKDLELLEKQIEKALDLQLRDHLLNEGNDLLAKLRFIEQQLKDAIDSKDIDALTQAVGEAREMEFHSKYLEKAHKLLLSVVKDVKGFLNQAISLKDIEMLKKAISKAKDSGLGDDALVAKATQLLTLLIEQEKIKKNMIKALENKDEKQVESLLVKAAECKLTESNSEVIQQAKEWKRDIHRVRGQLENAINQKKVAALRKYIEEANMLGLEFDEVVIRAAKMVRRIEEVSRNLDEAIRTQDHDDLKLAIEQAEDFGYSGALLDKAKRLLHRTSATEILKKAIISEDIEELGLAIELARKHGMKEDHPLYIEAVKLRATLSGREKVLEQIVKAVASKDPKLTASLLQQAAALGLDDTWDEIAEAQAYKREIDDSRRQLTTAMDSKVIIELESAVDVCLDLGLEYDREVIEGKDLLQRLEDADSALEYAITSKEIPELERALDDAKEVGLVSTKIKQAEKSLEKELILQALNTAIRKEDVNDLNAALDKARDAGLFGNPLVVEATKLRDVLQQQGKVKQQLKRAFRNEIKDEKLLDSLLVRAANCKLDSNCREVAEVEQWKNDVAGVRADIKAAMAKKDFGKLALAIARAKRLGLQYDPILVQAEAALAAHSDIAGALEEAIQHQDQEELSRIIASANEIRFQGKVLDTAIRLLERLKAISQLHIAIQSRNPDQLGLAIASARDANLNADHSLVVQAAKLRNLLIQQIKVKQQLAKALASKDEDLMTNLLHRANQLDIDESCEEVVLAVAWKRDVEACRSGLITAQKSKDMVKLTRGLKTASELGLFDVVIQDSQSLLQELQDAEDSLKDAIKSGEQDELIAALGEAKDCGLKSRFIEKAQRMLQAEEAKSLLKKAIADRNVDSLDRALAKAAKVLSSSSSLVLEALAIKRSLDTQDRVIASLKKAMSQSTKDESLIDMLLTRAKEYKMEETVFEVEQAEAWQRDVKDVRQKLSSAIKSKSVDELKTGIEDAQQLGLDDGALVMADAVSCLRACKDVDNALSEAIISKRQEALTKAIGEAKIMGYRSPYLGEAAKALQKEVILDKLRSACRSRNPNLLSEALEISTEAKLNKEHQHIEAAKLYESLTEQGGIKKDLNKALLSKNESLLKTLLARAVELGLDQWDEDVAAATTFVKQAEDTRKQIQHAVKTTNIEKLERALANAKTIGLDLDKTVINAQSLLDALRQAETDLKDGIRSKDLEQLGRAISDARATGFKGSLLSKAMRQMEKSKVLHKLREAIEKNDLEKLSTALEVSEAAGVSFDPIAVKARKLQITLVEQVKIRRALSKAVDATNDELVDALLSRGQEVGLDEKNHDYAAAAAWSRESHKLRNQVERGLERQNLDELEHAINNANRFGLEFDAQMIEASAQLSTLQKIEADLKDALVTRDPSELELAISEAQDLGFSSKTLESAIQTHEKLEILNFLRAASRTKDVVVLKKALVNAAEAKLNNEPETISAKKIFKELEEQEQILGSLSKAVTEKDEEKCESLLERAEELRIDRWSTEIAGAYAWVQKIKECRKQLKHASQLQDIPSLTRAITVAGHLGLDYDGQVNEAQDQLVRLEQIESSIKSAVSSGNQGDLAKAIASAQQIGYGSKLVEKAVRLQRKGATLGLLRSALQTKDLKLLEGAIKQSSASGLQYDPLFVEATQLRERLVGQADIRAQLRKAVENRDGPLIDTLLTRASELKLDLWVEEVASAHAFRKREREIQKHLAHAVSAKDSDVLKRALASAQKLGLDDIYVSEAKELIGTLTRVDKELVDSIESRDVNDLYKAIALAKESGIRSKLLDKAQRIFKKEKIIESVQDAIASSDISRLDNALETSRHAGLSFNPIVVKAWKLKDELQEQEKVKDALRKALKAKDIPLTEILLQRATEMKLDPSDDTIAKSSEWKKNVDVVKKKLKSAVALKNVKHLQNAIVEARKIGLQYDRSVTDCQALLRSLKQTNSSLQSLGKYL